MSLAGYVVLLRGMHPKSKALTRYHAIWEGVSADRSSFRELTDPSPVS
jgi:hypothetical protein